MNEGFPSPYTIDKAMEFITGARRSVNLLFAIEAEGRLVGSIGAFPGKHAEASIAYFLGLDFWRQGYGSAAIKGLTGFLTAEKGIGKIVAEPFASNGGSRRVLEKCGFTLMGVARNPAAKDRHRVDLCRYEYIA